VDAEGKNLGWCMQDVLHRIPDAVAWFARLGDKNEVLRILQEEKEDLFELWGFGNNPSPIRSYLSGYVALSIGDTELARAELQAAVESNCFTYLFSSVDGAINRAI
jgi:hypothetical protein